MKIVCVSPEGFLTSGLVAGFGFSRDASEDLRKIISVVAALQGADAQV